MAATCICILEEVCKYNVQYGCHLSWFFIHCVSYIYLVKSWHFPDKSWHTCSLIIKKKYWFGFIMQSYHKNMFSLINKSVKTEKYPMHCSRRLTALGLTALTFKQSESEWKYHVIRLRDNEKLNFPIMGDLLDRKFSLK